jgi:hypothetical protein
MFMRRLALAAASGAVMVLPGMGVVTAGPASASSATLLATPAAAAAPAAAPDARAAAATDLKFALNDVSVLSSSDAWAVGDSATVLHWNGTTWTPVTIPGLPVNAGLNAVDAVSASDVWAAGESFALGAPVTALIVHWDGTTWTPVPNPGPSGPHLIVRLNHLNMDSAADGWAIGDVQDARNGTSTGLVEHWNGTSWQQVTASPAFEFRGVASFSATNAWAVGNDRASSGKLTPAAFHWNGTRWTLAATLPVPSGVSPNQAFVSGLSAGSATDMWAIGAYTFDSGGSLHSKNLAWHWNGTAWTAMAAPSPGITSAGTSGLTGAAAISPANVWAVGFTETTNAQATVSVHWNGTSWARVATPNPGGINGSALVAVAATGPGNVWAVGSYNTHPDPIDEVPNTLILRWNGTRWIRS